MYYTTQTSQSIREPDRTIQKCSRCERVPRPLFAAPCSPPLAVVSYILFRQVYLDWLPVSTSPKRHSQHEINEYIFCFIVNEIQARDLLSR